MNPSSFPLLVTMRSLLPPFYKDEPMDLVAPDEGREEAPMDGNPNLETGDEVLPEQEVLRMYSVILGLDRGESLEKLQSDRRLEQIFRAAIDKKPEDREVADGMVYFAAKLYKADTLPAWIQELLKDPNPLEMLENPKVLFSLVKKGRLDQLMKVTRSDPAFWLSVRETPGSTLLHSALQIDSKKIALWLAQTCPALLTSTNDRQEQPLDVYKRRDEELDFIEKLTGSSTPWECLSYFCRLKDPTALWNYVESRSTGLLQTPLEDVGKIAPERNPFLVCPSLGKEALAVELIHRIFQTPSRTTDLIYAGAMGSPQFVEYVVSHGTTSPLLPPDGDGVTFHPLIKDLSIVKERELRSHDTEDFFFILALHYLLKAGLEEDAENLLGSDLVRCAFLLFYASTGSPLEDKYWHEAEKLGLNRLLEKIGEAGFIPPPKAGVVVAAIKRLLVSRQTAMSQKTANTIILRLLPLLNNLDLARKVFTSSKLRIATCVLGTFLDHVAERKMPDHLVDRVQQLLTMPEAAPLLGELILEEYGDGSLDAFAHLFYYRRRISFTMAIWLWKSFPEKCETWKANSSCQDSVSSAFSDFLRKRCQPEKDRSEEESDDEEESYEDYKNEAFEAFKIFIRWDNEYLQSHIHSMALNVRTYMFMFGDDEMRDLLPKDTQWTVKEMAEILAFVTVPENSSKLDAKCKERILRAATSMAEQNPEFVTDMKIALLIKTAIILITTEEDLQLLKEVQVSHDKNVEAFKKAMGSLNLFDMRSYFNQKKGVPRVNLALLEWLKEQGIGLEIPPSGEITPEFYFWADPLLTEWILLNCVFLHSIQLEGRCQSSPELCSGLNQWVNLTFAVLGKDAKYLQLNEQCVQRTLNRFEYLIERLPSSSEGGNPQLISISRLHEGKKEPVAWGCFSPRKVDQVVEENSLRCQVASKLREEFGSMWVDHLPDPQVFFSREWRSKKAIGILTLKGNEVIFHSCTRGKLQSEAFPITDLHLIDHLHRRIGEHERAIHESKNAIQTHLSGRAECRWAHEVSITPPTNGITIIFDRAARETLFIARVLSSTIEFRSHGIYSLKQCEWTINELEYCIAKKARVIHTRNEKSLYEALKQHIIPFTEMTDSSPQFIRIAFGKIVPLIGTCDHVTGRWLLLS